MDYRTAEAINAVYTVAALNIYAVSVGILMGPIIAMAAVPPRELVAEEQGIQDLREALGSEVVDRALREVPDRNILRVAEVAERLVKAGMVSKYGVWAADLAWKAAPPGDIRTAREIAATLSGQGITPASPVVKVEKAIETGKKNAWAGRKPPKRTLDTKTGIEYPAMWRAASAIAAEYGLDPTDTRVFYKIREKDPTRLKVLE